MENKKRFAEIMATLGSVFQREVDKPLVRIYWEVLSKHSDEQVNSACQIAITRCRHFPKPIDIEELIPSTAVSRFEAWGAVMFHLENNAACQDPMINEAVRRLGGWTFLSEQTYDDLQYQSKRFMDHFEDIKERDTLRIEAGTRGRLAELAEHATKKKELSNGG